MKEINPEILEKAIEILTANNKCSLNSQKKLREYIEKRVDQIDTCVFYKFSEESSKILQKLKIDFGKQELVIEPTKLQYTKNYGISPKEILKIE